MCKCVREWVYAQDGHDGKQDAERLLDIATGADICSAASRLDFDPSRMTPNTLEEVYICVHTHTYIYICVYICICIHIYIYIYVYMYIYMHLYICIYIYTYIHI